MKLARYRDPAGTVGVGAMLPDGPPDAPLIAPLWRGGARTDPAAGVPELLAIATAVSAGRPAPTPVGDVLPVRSVTLLAPVLDPPSVRDFYAFEQHVRTARSRRRLGMNQDWYALPVFYFSNPGRILGPDEPVHAPAGCAQLDFELEVAVVLGRDHTGPLSAAGAADLVAGFTVLNDWSARDVQAREMALSMGPVKGKDFATSLGPVLVTVDEFAPGGLARPVPATMTARLNGATVSLADLDELYWTWAELLAYAADGSRLRAGDVIGSGTCGTGCLLELIASRGPDRYRWLQPGDVVELEVAGLGVLRTPVGPPAAAGFVPDAAARRPAYSDDSPDAALLRATAAVERLTAAVGARPDRAADTAAELGACAQTVQFWLGEARAVAARPPLAPPASFGPPPGAAAAAPTVSPSAADAAGAAPAAPLERVWEAVAAITAILGDLSPAELSARGTHPTLGVMTVRQIVDRLALGGLELHAAQLEQGSAGGPPPAPAPAPAVPGTAPGTPRPLSPAASGR